MEPYIDIKPALAACDKIRTPPGISSLIRGTLMELAIHAADIEEIVRQNILHGGRSIVPRTIALCPECGGQLVVRSQQWDAQTGVASFVELECENDMIDDPGVSGFHRWHQSDWQPVIDRVESWFRVRGS